VIGYGRATITILDETFSEIPDSPCLDTTRVEAIDLIGRSDELVLDEAGTFCPPGRSGDSHAGPNSYGHPGRWRLLYTVDGGSSSGVFAGATGSGRDRFHSAGGVGVWRVFGGPPDHRPDPAMEPLYTSSRPWRPGRAASIVIPFEKPSKFLRFDPDRAVRSRRLALR
jgi:hypothetical protein